MPLMEPPIVVLRNEPEWPANSISDVLHCQSCTPMRVLGNVLRYAGDMNMRCRSMLVRMPRSSL